MNSAGFWQMAALGALGSWAGTWGMRRYAESRRLLDVPNPRSSHSAPTPRGGGVAFVVVFLLLLVAMAAGGDLPAPALLALAGSGALVGAVGFVDDHRHLPAGWRLAAHFAAAVWALGCLGGFPPVVAFGARLELGWLGNAVAAFYLVWLLNLYNFMDGIDGIAGLEAVTVAGGGAVLWWLSSGSPGSTVAMLLAACVSGFLVWNFPPARIFMGDAGSGFLGMLLGILSVWSAGEAPAMFWSWLILLGVFVVDATITLFRRMRRRESLHQAHRSHAYQYASRRYGSHRPVSLAVAAINLLWLLPLAAAAAFGWIEGMVALTIAYAPLVVLAWRLRAGAAELQET